MGFCANRSLAAGDYCLRDVFSGLDNVEVLVNRVGGASALKLLLDETRVALREEDDYMYVNDDDGSLVVGLEYLKTGDAKHLYLDVIHELVHVRQYREGRELFDRSFSYVDRATEIEAYECCVEEARRLGMSDKEVADYLYVEWITKDDHAKLLRTLGVRATLN